MKAPVVLLILIFLSACTSTKFRVIDDKGSPVKEAVVLSTEFSFFSPAKHSIFITEETGEGFSYKSFPYIFKDNYHPIIWGSDVIVMSGFDKRYPSYAKYEYYEFIRETQLNNDVILYPVKNPDGSPYNDALINTEAINNKIKIEFESCDYLNIEYNIQDAKFTVTSESKPFYPSARFFFSLSSPAPVNEFINEEYISFYCHDEENKLFKAGYFVHKGYAAYREKLTKPTILMLSYEPVSRSEYIEPPYRPIVPELLKASFWREKPVLNHELEATIKILENNLPQRSQEEINFKSKWLNFVGNQNVNK